MKVNKKINVPFIQTNHLNFSKRFKLDTKLYSRFLHEFIFGFRFLFISIKKTVDFEVFKKCVVIHYFVYFLFFKRNFLIYCQIISLDNQLIKHINDSVETNYNDYDYRYTKIIKSV